MCCSANWCADILFLLESLTHGLPCLVIFKYIFMWNVLIHIRWEICIVCWVCQSPGGSSGPQSVLSSAAVCCQPTVSRDAVRCLPLAIPSPGPMRYAVIAFLMENQPIDIQPNSTVYIYCVCSLGWRSSVCPVRDVYHHLRPGGLEVDRQPKTITRPSVDL